MPNRPWDRIGGTMRKLGGKEGHPSHLGNSLEGKTFGDVRLYFAPKPSPKIKESSREESEKEMGSFIQYFKDLLKDADLMGFYKKNNSLPIFLTALKNKCAAEKLDLSVKWSGSYISFCFTYQNNPYIHQTTIELFQKFLEDIIKE